MKILVFETPEINVEALDLLRQAGHEIAYHDGSMLAADEVDVIVVKTYTKVDQGFLSQYPGLKYVIRAGSGLDTIDVKYCAERGIKIFNSPGANAEAVAEFVVGAMIWLSRQLQIQRQSLQDGSWRTFEALGTDLSSHTVGILGCGRIGALVAQKLKLLGVTSILGFDPRLTESQLASQNMLAVSRTELFSRSTMLSLHLPLIDETRHSIGETELALMPKGSYLINTSRGEILDESALLLAIDSGKIAGAALDVFSSEPNINPQLVSHPRILATPHIAGFTHSAQKQMAVQAVTHFIRETTG